MLSSLSILTAEEQPKDIQECSRELLLSYFPEPFVRETLSRFQVSEDKTEDIVSQLSNQDQEVIKKVESKAAKLDPNPLKNFADRQKAVQLFRESLLEIFSDVMKRNGVRDDRQIQSMLDDIQHQKARYFVRCMEKQQSQTPSNELPASSEESEEVQDNNTEDAQLEDVGEEHNRY
jgi:hypothetical protein